jgi:hypothetical protein
MTPVTFRFLDLPKELRLMVYERITPATHRSVVKHQSVTKLDPATANRNDGAKGSEPSMMVICKTLDVALLATCSQIYHEARPFLAPKLQELMVEPVRLLMDYKLFIAGHGAMVRNQNPGSPMLTCLFARCLALAAQRLTPQATQHPHQIEIALTGECERGSEVEQMRAFLALWHDAQDFGVSVALFAQGPLRDITLIRRPTPMIVPWRIMWDMVRQDFRERVYGGAVETVVKVTGLDEDEWSNFWPKWEAL